MLPFPVPITRTLEFPPDRVYDAWLDPKLVGRWMFGPALRDEEVLRVEIDPRVGGQFSFCVRRNGQELDHVGEYRVLDRPRRLVFTWGVKPETAQSQVSVDISPSPAGCEVTIVHELHPDWIEYAAQVKAAWSHMLTVLARTL